MDIQNAGLASVSFQTLYPKDSDAYRELCREAAAGKFRILAIAQPSKKESQQHGCLWVVQVYQPPAAGTVATQQDLI